MEIIGLRLKAKYLNLDVKEVQTRVEFAEQISGGFSGLVLYHGDPFRSVTGGNRNKAESILSSVFMPAANQGRCAILIFETNAYSRPPECTSPFLHFYSVGIPNEEPNLFEPLFLDLTTSFRSLSAMPSQNDMVTLWKRVDPFLEYRVNIRLLEGILNSRTGEGQTLDAQSRAALGTHYGQIITTYDDVKSEYLKLCDSRLFMRRLNKWHARREYISHDLFHHTFYALICRPAVRQLMEAPTGELPAGLIKTLERWPALGHTIRDLLDDANPGAILSRELTIALLRPDDPRSVSIKEGYEVKYKAAISDLLNPTYEALNALDEEVGILLGSSRRNAESYAGARASNLIELCTDVSTCLSSLGNKAISGDLRD